MTDLESACRELMDDLRDASVEAERKADEIDLIGSSAYGRGVADAHDSIADKLESIVDEHTPDAAERLAEQTGEPRERFEADDKPIPELDDLESEVKELVDTMEDAT